MKRLLLILFCLSAYIFSEAQLRLAITGGPQSAGIKEVNTLPGWTEEILPGYSNRTSFHIGFTGDLPFSGRWSFQPGILYSGKGRKFSRFYPEEEYLITDTMYKGGNFFPNYIEVPLNIAYKFPLGKHSSFFIAAGPYLGFFYNGTSSSENRLFFSNQYHSTEQNIETGSEKNSVSTTDFGLNAKAGFEFRNFFIAGFHSNGLKDFYEAAYEGSFKHRVSGASIGIWLNKKEILVKDKDGDGIPDNLDKCPEQPGSELTGGCPDKDGDGIADIEDDCPDVAGTLKYKGCPIPDTDGDGINDEEDQCPEIPGIAKYNGCPIPDRDGDGINDEEDKCPDTPGKKAYHGCPVPDSDGDGINDEEDKCPNEPGVASNYGCPLISKEVTEKVNLASRNIFFKINSAELTTSSYEGLNEVISILEKDKNLQLDIQGHTDNSGRSAYNKQLSQYRADAVKAYLIQKGIEASRLTATGYGDEKPIVENNTEENRAKNRRVELHLRLPDSK